MAVTSQALSPWPPTTMPSQRTAAIARLKATVAGRAAESDEAACALGEAAAARVEAYAPDAPQALRDEAAIRFAGYLAQADFATVKSETIGPRSTEYNMDHAAAWRNSGAAMLLSPWRVRRAGKIG